MRGVGYEKGSHGDQSLINFLEVTSVAVGWKAQDGGELRRNKWQDKLAEVRKKEAERGVERETKAF